jgi:hypothetical protein
MSRNCVFLGLLLMIAGCYSMAEGPTAKRGEKHDGIDSSSKKDVADVAFDSKRAMGYLEELCNIGPRISGSEGMKKQQSRLKKHFEDLGATVTMQEFKVKQNSRRDETQMTNMVISWHPDRKQRVLLCSHYDTRPIADQERNERNWTKPFLSANDGTSGVAFLMELAHHMKDLNTPIGVDFVLFDGEEYIYDNRPEEQGGDKYFFGSEHFADNYAKEKHPHSYRAGVLLDMIAGQNPHFPMEVNSMTNAGAIVEELWGIAAELKCKAFEEREGPSVLDDHIALNRRARIHTVDIIDFGYKYWHRLNDIPENCSTEGMEQVAKVLTTWLVRAKAPE